MKNCQHDHYCPEMNVRKVVVSDLRRAISRVWCPIAGARGETMINEGPEVQTTLPFPSPAVDGRKKTERYVHQAQGLGKIRLLR